MRSEHRVTCNVRANPLFKYTMRRFSITLLVMCLMLCSRLAAAQSEPRIAINEPFPVITLPALDGSMMSVADFRGKRILLHVFASW